MRGGNAARQSCGAIYRLSIVKLWLTAGLPWPHRRRPGIAIENPFRGKGDRYGRAAAELALQLQGAAMRLDQRLDQGEAEAGPFVFAGQGTIDLTEGCLHFWNIAGVDADPGIGDAEGKAAVFVDLGAHRDLAPRRRELDRIG